MFDTECLHTPFLPPPSSSSYPRSPKVRPHALTTVPEGTLVNLDEGYLGTPPRDQPKRRPGFAKRPGGADRIRKNNVANGLDIEDAGVESENDDDWEEEEWVPDVFLFEYGTVVIWGMTEKEEKSFLRML
jgi:uncharacterized Rmd1/YagE family protein